MSKYTTEVRFICESKAGLNESTGAGNVDDVISKSWDKIFTSNVNFFDENYRSVICQKILKHYYLREIGAETVGVWLLWMNERLEMIMPYYNQLYESAKIKFDPMTDVNLTRKHDGTTAGNSKVDESRKETSSDNVKDSGVQGYTLNETSRDLYSDTPQGAITGLENEDYLTNARKVSRNNTQNIENNNSRESSGSVDVTNSSTGSSNSTENYVESIVGKQGSGSFTKMLVEFRDSLINIDKEVISEFSDLFMGLW